MFLFNMKHIQLGDVIFGLCSRRFRSLIPSYIRDSSVAVISYDITSEC